MHAADWQEDIRRIVEKWMQSDEGLQWEAEIYQVGFDEGWENARAQAPELEPLDLDEDDWWNYA
jgi:hypothetical protein